jgi:DNA helicase II / ATP-dependent DNA helicase PcrA
VVDGCMPADMAAGSSEEIEEERRLLYVAMTRAQQQLQLLVPRRFHVTQQAARGDRHLWGGLSRFIPPAVAAHFEQVAACAPASEDAVAAVAAVAATPLPAIDLGARVRMAWE